MLALIDQFHSEAPVELLCSVFEVTRSCYYAYRRKQRSPDVARLALRVRVNELFTQAAVRPVAEASLNLLPENGRQEAGGHAALFSLLA